MDAKVKERYDKELAKLNTLLEKKTTLDAQIKAQQAKVDKIKATLDIGELKSLESQIAGLGMSVTELKDIIANGGLAQYLKKDGEEKKESAESTEA